MRFAPGLAIALAVALVLTGIKAWALMLLNGWAHANATNIPAFGWRMWMIVLIAHAVVASSLKFERFEPADFE